MRKRHVMFHAPDIVIVIEERDGSWRHHRTYSYVTRASLWRLCSLVNDIDCYRFVRPWGWGAIIKEEQA